VRSSLAAIETVKKRFLKKKQNRWPAPKNRQNMLVLSGKRQRSMFLRRVEQNRPTLPGRQDLLRLKPENPQKSLWLKVKPQKLDGLRMNTSQENSLPVLQTLTLEEIFPLELVETLVGEMLTPKPLEARMKSLARRLRENPLPLRRNVVQLLLCLTDPVAMLMLGRTSGLLSLVLCAETVPLVENRPRSSARQERKLANPSFREVSRRMCIPHFLDRRELSGCIHFSTTLFVTNLFYHMQLERSSCSSESLPSTHSRG
jgi:hypothetical protein